MPFMKHVWLGVLPTLLMMANFTLSNTSNKKIATSFKSHYLVTFYQFQSCFEALFSLKLKASSNETCTHLFLKHEKMTRPCVCVCGGGDGEGGGG
jgi:hypothetical protein